LVPYIASTRTILPSFSFFNPGFAMTLTLRPYACIYGHMKTTIDLPDEILHRAKIVAAQRRTTLKELFLSGLELVMKSDAEAPARQTALARLRQGLRLGGQPLTRKQAHERR
jgi:hypothetical protein